MSTAETVSSYSGPYLVVEYIALCSHGLLVTLYNPIQMMLTTTSNPLSSPPSYLKLHIPSVFSFQYAPVALCIPLRPTCGLPSVLVASVLTAFSSLASVSDEVIGRDFESAAVGTRCWMIVLFTAYLNAGGLPFDVSEINDLRIVFWLC